MENNRSLIELAKRVPSPCYLMDKGLLRRNAEILAGVKKRTGCKILLALKAFSAWGLFELFQNVLDGTTASSLFEAKLGKEYFGGENHVYSPAFSEGEIDELSQLVDHVVFNSVAQFERYSKRMLTANPNIECALRINPLHSEVECSLYNPCSPKSHLGVRLDALPDTLASEIKGLHFHALCENNSDSLERMLRVVERKFGKYFKQIKWINFGGGHHITREDYDVDLLCDLIIDFRNKYELPVYLEPGEAVALYAGYLVATVLDVVQAERDVAILDTSASAHMPDILEMPYRPDIKGAGQPDIFAHTYRLAGRSCMAGDIIGEYSFEQPLEPGDKLVFDDMAHYTMVKNTNFNGLNLPAVVFYDPETDEIEVRPPFTYGDFKKRLS